MDTILITQLDTTQIDELLQYVPDYSEVNFDNIRAKCLSKIQTKNNSRQNYRSFKMFLVAAIIMALLAVTTVFAAEISDFIKSFLNKTGIYATVVDGSAYYLESPVKLENDERLLEVMFTAKVLNINLEMKREMPPDVKIVASGNEYVPQGFSRGQYGLSLSFYDFDPVQEFDLIIDGKAYSVSLVKGNSVVNGGDIIPAEPNIIDWVNIGYRCTDEYVQIFTSFTDKELKLTAIGLPYDTEISATFDNENNSDHIFKSLTKPLIGYDKENNAYEFKTDASSVGRPITQFTTDAPADQEISLKVPGIIVSYEKEFLKFNVDIPAIGEMKNIDSEIDLGLQKIVLQNITRTSASTAKLTFNLDTGKNSLVSVYDAVICSEDIQNGELLWKDNRCVMNIYFDESLNDVEISLSWPRFIIYGDWTLNIRSEKS